MQLGLLSVAERVEERRSLKVEGWFSIQAVVNAGNLVRIEDGCATVTGYKLPRPLVQFVNWEGGGEVRSPEVRTSARLRSSGPVRGHFSDKEKDEASPLQLFSSGLFECLHSRFCRSLKAVSSPGFALVSQSPTVH